MKKLIMPFLVTALVSPFFSSSLLAISTAVYPIFDSYREEAIPQNLQILKQIPDSTSSCNLLGLEELKASGSGQFSEANFSALLNALPIQSEQLIICDLREECHGLINGLPAIWKDEPILNQTAEEIQQEEDECSRLALDAGHLLIKQGKKQVDLVVSQAITERSFVEGKEHIYVRFPIKNYNRPNDQLVDQFVQFINCLSFDQWVHFHCRTGKEATTTYLTLLDMMKNSHSVSLEDILARHELISGIHLKDFQPIEEGLEEGELERHNFLCEFYNYCQQVSDFSIPWSEWIQQRTSLSKSSEVLEREFQQVMQTGQEDTEDSLSTEDMDDYSAEYVEMFFSPDPTRLINERFGYKQPLLASNFDVDDLFSDVCCRHHDKQSRGGDRGGYGHENKNKGGYDARIKGGVTWGDPDKGVTWHGSLEAEAHDGKGNYVEGGITHRSDGTGGADITGGRRESR